MLNQNKNTFDIIIVGCGPVGAALANFLRLYGYTVGIFERYKEVFYAPRAMGADDEAQRIFQRLGILKRLVEEGHLKKGGATFADGNGKTLIEISESTLDLELLTSTCGHFFSGIFDQPSCERILREEFEKGSEITAFYEYDVLSIFDHGDSVSLKAKNLNTNEEEVYTAKYLVGCDGANSMVRKEITDDFHNYEYNERYLVVDTIIEDKNYLNARIPEGGIFHLDPKSSGVLAKGLHGHVRLDFLLEKDGSFLHIVKDLIEARNLDPDKFKVIRNAPYKFEAKSPKSWRKGNFIIIGDAAHVTPPWGVQGLNMGFRDTINLAFKLDLLLKGKVGDKILDTLYEERITPTLHTIKSSVKTGKLMTDKNRLTIGFRNFVYFLGRKNRFIRELIYKDVVVKPPYKKGLIGKNHHLAGTVMIQPKVTNPKIEDINQPLHWMDDLIGLHFAIISIGRCTGPAVYDFLNDWDGKILRYNIDYADDSRKVLAWFKKHKVKHILVRPDKYIFDAGNDANALCDALIRTLKNL